MFNRTETTLSHGNSLKPSVRVWKVVTLHCPVTRTMVFEVIMRSPLPARGKRMALNVQMYKVHNMLTDEDIVIPRLVIL